jgi:hypothetical protein
MLLVFSLYSLLLCISEQTSKERRREKKREREGEEEEKKTREEKNMKHFYAYLDVYNN